jgi:hypothetical protein
MCPASNVQGHWIAIERLCISSEFDPTLASQHNNVSGTTILRSGCYGQTSQGQPLRPFRRIRNPNNRPRQPVKHHPHPPPPPPSHTHTRTHTPSVSSRPTPPSRASPAPFRTALLRPQPSAKPSPFAVAARSAAAHVRVSGSFAATPIARSESAACRPPALPQWRETHVSPLRF